MSKLSSKTFIVLAFLAGGIVFSFSRAFAEDTPLAPPEPSEAFRTYRANQSLLMKLKKERESLLEAAKTDPSESLQRKLAGADYKIKALEEDAQKIQTTLGPQEQVYAMLSILAEEKMIAEKKPAQLTEVEEGTKRSVPAEAVTLEPGSPNKELHEKALAYVAEQRLEDAVRIYQEIILQDPEDDQAYMIMGHCYLLQGFYTKAEEAFDNAVHIDEANVNEIVPFYENMTMQNPNDDAAFSNLGYSLVIVGDFIKAQEAFKEALRINPSNTLARRGIAMLEAGR